MNNKNRYKKLLKGITLVLLSTFTFAACKKNEEQKPTPVKNARIALMISSPEANEVSFFVKDKKFSTAPLLYNTIVNYITVSEGSQELFFKNKDASLVVNQLTANLKSEGNYTLIFADKSPKTAMFLIEDDLSDPEKDKAKVRFANLSPDAPALDLYVNGKLETTLSNKEFKQTSAFQNIDPGTTLKFELKEHGKTEVLATLENFHILSSKIYTIWARGLKESTTTNKLGLEAMTNR